MRRSPGRYGLPVRARTCLVCGPLRRILGREPGLGAGRSLAEGSIPPAWSQPNRLRGWSGARHEAPERSPVDPSTCRPPPPEASFDARWRLSQRRRSAPAFCVDRRGAGSGIDLRCRRLVARFVPRSEDAGARGTRGLLIRRAVGWCPRTPRRAGVGSNWRNASWKRRRHTSVSPRQPSTRVSANAESSTRPVTLDCQFETICERCGFYDTGPQFVEIIRRQHNDAIDHGDHNRAEIFTQLLDGIDDSP